MIEFLAVTKHFKDKYVLREQSLAVSTGEFVSILGPSGCGKTTLLRLIADLERPDTGKVQLGIGREHLAYVFQEPHLLPWKNVFENVALPLQLRKQANPVEKIDRVLVKVGLAEAKNLLPHELSGGMRMRTSLARALVTAPQLLLMDEPFAALDELIRFRLEEELRILWAQEKMTVFFVTHSVTEAVFLSSRCILFTSQGLKNFPIDLPTVRDASCRKMESFYRTVEILSSELGKAT